MGNASDLKGVVCNAFAYGPFDSCLMSTIESDGYALSDELSYLDKEWDRISSLGFDPTFVLGKNPPWIVENP